MTKHMILRLKDDAYFYKVLGEKNRIAEVLYEIRETVNKNFKHPFVKDIGYYLNKTASTYEYVVTIAYETDDESEPKPTLVLIEKNRKFTMNVRKMDYENYGEVFAELKSSIEKEMDRKIAKYFDEEHPDYTITDKESEWVEEEDANVLVVNVTYTAPYNAEEKIKE